MRWSVQQRRLIIIDALYCGHAGADVLRHVRAPCISAVTVMSMAHVLRHRFMLYHPGVVNYYDIALY